MVTLKQLLWLSLHSKLCDFYRDAILSPMFPETRRICSGVRSYDDLSAVGIKCLGIGKDTQHAVSDATKRLNAIYKRLAPGQYENFAAMKWSYLDPEYLIEDQVILPDHKILCIIEQLG